MDRCRPAGADRPAARSRNRFQRHSHQRRPAAARGDPMSAETVKSIIEAAPAFATVRSSHRLPSGETWPEPEPLIAPDEEPRPYPVDALPGHMQRAVRAYQSYGKQPMALVACSALGSLSLAA